MTKAHSEGVAWKCGRCEDETGEKIPCHHRLCPRRGEDDEHVAVIDREQLRQIQRLSTFPDPGQGPDRG